MIRAILIISILGLSTQGLLAQTGWPAPFSEANKAMAALKNEPLIIDSLKRVYKRRWTIGVAYGQRFLADQGRSADPDKITFTDFTDVRSFFGVEGGYFITSRFHLSLAFDILLLPKKQGISNISIGGDGIQAEGSGSGGAMTNIGFGSKYYFPISAHDRLYLGLKIGRLKAIAEGGIGGFNSSQGQFRETIRLSRNYTYGNPTIGYTHRITPGFMVDFNAGYLYATDSENIGGMLSPEGITSTLTLQFIIGKRK
jgi:hypothetical protein